MTINIKKINYTFPAIAITLIFFTSIFIFNAHLGVFPDEKEHFQLVKEAANYSFFHDVFQGSQLKSHGPLETKPYLYYKLSALAYKIFDDDRIRLVAVRLISLFFAVGYLYVSYLLISRFFCTKFYAALATLTLALTYSFIYISAAVSWDMAVNFASIIILYVTFLLHDKLINDHKIDLNLFTILCLVFFIGFLAKWSLLLIALISFTILFTIIIYYLLTQQRLIFKYKLNYTAIFILISTCLFAYFAIKFYLPMFLKYNSINPECADVWSTKLCSDLVAQHRVHYQLIADNVGVIHKSILEYFITFCLLNIERLLGFFGHVSVIALKVGFKFFTFIIFALVISAFNIDKYQITSVDVKKILVGIAVCVLFFAAYYIQNYEWYSKIKVTGAAVQGRYLLGIYPVAIAILYSIFERSRLKVVGIILAISMPLVVFVFGLGRDWLNGNLQLILVG